MISRNRPSYLLLLLLLYAYTLPSAAVEIDNFAVTTKMTYASEIDGGQDQRREVEISPQLDLAISDIDRVRLSLRARYDGSYDIGDEILNDTYADGSSPWRRGEHLAMELREFYWERPINAAHIKLGKQQIVFGSLDGIKLLDVVNPQSLQEFILWDFSDSRIPSWSAMGAVPIGTGQLELVWVPDSTAHELPITDSAFSPTSSRFRYGFSYSGEGSDLLQRDRLEVDRFWEEPAFAARLSGFFGGWDLATSIVSGKDFLPVAQVRRDSTSLVLDRSYKRRTIYGFSAEKSIGSFSFRSETALRHNLALNSLSRSADPTTLRIEEADKLGVAVAVDWDGPASLFVNAQLLYEKVVDAPDSLISPVEETLFTLYANRKFLYDTLHLEIRWYSIVNHQDELVRPAVRYDLADNTYVRLGADLFYGSDEGLFGQFEDASRYILEIEHVF